MLSNYLIFGLYYLYFFTTFDLMLSMFIPLSNFKVPGERKYPVYFSFGPADGFVTLEPQDLRSHLGDLPSL